MKVTRYDHHDRCIGCCTHADNECAQNCPLDVTFTYLTRESVGTVLRAAAQMLDPQGHPGFDVHSAIVDAVIDLVGPQTTALADADTATDVMCGYVCDAPADLPPTGVVFETLRQHVPDSVLLWLFGSVVDSRDVIVRALYAAAERHEAGERAAAQCA